MNLERCPFCGGEAQLDTWSPMLRSSVFYVVTCTDCGATTWPYVADAGGAVNLWNRRPEK